MALGGTLVQDIPSLIPESNLRHMQKTLSFDTDHEAEFTPGSRLFELFGPSIRINSRHHQCIELPGKGLKITAKAPDGVIEGAEHESLPIDLVQWHPELLMQKDDAMLPAFSNGSRGPAGNENERLRGTQAARHRSSADLFAPGP